MNNMLKVLAIMGIGLGSFMIYKLYNPDCIQDMKESLDNITKSASKKMGNMKQ